MISPERIRAVVVIDDDTLDDATLTVMVARAIAFVETQTGRYFREVQAYTEFVTGYGAPTLELHSIPVEDSETITVAERLHPGGSATALLADVDFELRAAPRHAWLVRYAGLVWHCGYEYEIGYHRGYAVDGLPGDIEELVLGLISLRVGRRGREDLRSETIDNYSYTRFGTEDLDALDGAQATIDAWHREVFA